MHRFSQNGKPSTQLDPDAASSDYVKNEVDVMLDRINDLWMKLERKLLREQPPRRIACWYDSKEIAKHGEIMEHRFLGIQRHSGKWRICYANVCGVIDEEKLFWKPVVECDVLTRADAVRGINQLKREVGNTRKLFIPALEKAISTLEEALNNDEE